MTARLPRPPYDAAAAEALAKIPFPFPITRELLPALRESWKSVYTAATAVAGKSVSHEEKTIPGPGGDIILSILRSTAPTATTATTSAGDKGRPGIYMIHGGGMIMGTRFLLMDTLADWVVENNAVGISVEYRLAPEHPDPAPVEDCYAGLKWVGEHASEIGIDPERLVIVGQSGGGGLAAGTALLARDRGGPPLYGQLLVYPMLDDRNESVSAMQYIGEKTWDRDANIMAWTCVLGDRRGGKDVSIYAAPGRATDLSGLPQTFIDVGGAETFRDESVAYASLLWASGISTELHVWAGAFHGLEGFAPIHPLAQSIKEERSKWLRRILSPVEDTGISDYVPPKFVPE